MIKKVRKFARQWVRQMAFPGNDLAQAGTLGAEDLGLLKELSQRANAFPGDFVEIGALFGHTSQRLALWKDPKKKLIAVDNFGWNPWLFSPAEHEAVTANNLHYLIETGHVELVKADKNEFYRTRSFATPPALVFLDAIHSYPETLKDIEWARRIGAKIICGHDHTPDHPGVGQAVAEAGGAERIVGSVWVLK